MKKTITELSLLGGFALLLAGALFLGSCEGPAGADGADGADGIDGIDGVDGTDGTEGVAGNAVCLECHITAVKTAVETQWAASLHGTSQTFYPGSPTTVQYAGGRNDCAKCHSHEGFVETVWTGLDTTAADIPIPQPVRCKTCHDFHSSLDFENEPNSAIRETRSVKLIAGGDMVEFDNAESNLCMHCHQSREEAPDDTDGAAIVEIAEHWGPHHGPQANLINGLVGYDYRGEVASVVGGGPHDCVSCHMGDVVGDTIGGHTWVADVEGCAGCHTVVDVHSELVLLQDALFAAGMVDAAGHAIESDEDAGVVVEYQADSAGALWNYILLEEDASMGIHNSAYALDLIDASIKALTAATK